MIFYDFEVFKEDWLAVFIDVTKKKEYVIINNPDELKALYEANSKDIWVGYNNRHYDQYIMKGILLGMNPKRINDWIIVEKKEGWQFSSAFNKVPMINYDVMPNPPVGLKTLEGFLGSNIKETDVDFRINRKLTKEEIEMTVFYCRHDVEETIKVFLEKIDEFNAMHGIIQAFPDIVNLSDIGDSEARITAKVLGCSRRSFEDEFDFYFLPCLQLKKYKYVQDWFEQKRQEALSMDLAHMDKYSKRTWYKEQGLETVVAGIPHSFGFGGVHGATATPIHKTGQLLHVDVNNYYPSMLIAWGLVTRAATNDNYPLVYNTRKAMKEKQIAAKNAGNKKEVKRWKKAQLPYKKMLNALSGAMKDETNAAYDPRMLWSSFFVTLVAKKIVLINLCCRPCFIWGSITIITVWTNMIIINVCKFFYLLIECFLCCKLIQICAFILQGIEVTLHRCIVVRISCFAHALCHIYRFAEFGKCFGRIL